VVVVQQQGCCESPSSQCPQAGLAPATQAVITDKGVVVPLMEENIRANGLQDWP
jgi:hypothetical protein